MTPKQLTSHLTLMVSRSASDVEIADTIRRELPRLSDHPDPRTAALVEVAKELGGCVALVAFKVAEKALTHLDGPGRDVKHAAALLEKAELYGQLARRAEAALAAFETEDGEDG